MPATFAGGSEEAWQEVAREEVRPSEVDEPGAQGEVRLEVSRRKGAELMRPVEPGSKKHGRRTVDRETRGCPLADRS